MIHVFKDVEDISIKDRLDMDCFDGGYELLSDDKIIANILFFRFFSLPTGIAFLQFFSVFYFLFNIYLF